MHLLVVHPPDQTVPVDTAELVRGTGWSIDTAHDYRSAMAAADGGRVGAVIVAAPDTESGSNTRDRKDFAALLGLIDSKRIAGVVLSNDTDPIPSSRASLIDTLSSPPSIDDLRGRFAMIERYHAVVKRMERELDHMQRLGNRLNQHFHEIDQELQLAGRLQRDFLPSLTEPMGRLRFAVSYHPASWVSGDIYDCFRIDETHTGFYIADAVGHGMASGLLTMFINRTVVPKLVEANGYRVLSPSEVLANLNDAIAAQGLPQCQFVTACYGLFNHQTSVLQIARGGHPYPIRIDGKGAVSELKSPGGLLGVFQGEEFPTIDVELKDGDKLLLYTDGVEHAFRDCLAPVTGGGACLQPIIQPVASLNIEGIISELDGQLDENRGADGPKDDVTFLGVEVMPR